MDILFIGTGIACKQQMRDHFAHNMAQVHTHKHFQICIDISQQLSLYTSSTFIVHMDAFSSRLGKLCGVLKQRYIYLQHLVTQKICYCVYSSMELSVLSTRGYFCVIVSWTYQGVVSAVSFFFFSLRLVPFQGSP